jgi:hypothetical protein
LPSLDQTQGKLALRFRHASEEEVKFMKNFNKRESPFLSQFSTFLTPDSARETAGQLLKRNTSISKKMLHFTKMKSPPVHHCIYNLFLLFFTQMRTASKR